MGPALHLPETAKLSLIILRSLKGVSVVSVFGIYPAWRRAGCAECEKHRDRHAQGDRWNFSFIEHGSCSVDSLRQAYVRENYRRLNAEREKACDRQRTVGDPR
jgi:hypothetical protein